MDRQKRKAAEQEKATQLHVINEMSSDSLSEEEESRDAMAPNLNDLEQLVAIGPDIEEHFSSEKSPLEISEE